MSFLIQRATGRGLTLTQIQGPVLRIGRGTNQELRSENPAVALEHGTIEVDAAGYFVTDKGSITGTYVNGRPVESARLVKGDLVEIGDLRAGASLILAALAAEGTTTIHGAHHVHRGYENIERKFLDIGASISRTAEGSADTSS